MLRIFTPRGSFRSKCRSTVTRAVPEIIVTFRAKKSCEFQRLRVQIYVVFQPFCWSK